MLLCPVAKFLIAAFAIDKVDINEAFIGENGGESDEVKQQLEAFEKKRDAMLADIKAGLGELQGKSACAWVFTAQGDTASTLLQLVQDIPQPSAVYTAAMMLVGDNLEGIRSMIHEFEPDTGA